MKPVKNLLHIKPDEKEAKNAAGIYMQKAWDGPQNKGEILSAGPDAEYKAGERVVFNPYALIQVELEDGNQYLLRDSDVLGTL